jgi:outer membrane biosynthesis protein TonB
MFASLNPQSARRQRVWLAGSLLLHGALLAWVLYPPEPRLLMATSIAHGQNGRVVARLYWETQSPDDSSASSSPQATQKYRRQRLGQQRLVWMQNTQLAKLPAPAAVPNAEDKSQTQTLSNEGHGAKAGASYGTLYRGPAFGDEIRPALPTATSDPVVYPWQLPDTSGNEVIEITIDERGEIVRKVVLASLGPEIDAKCLAALDNWHFHPATHNGVPIASKQDAIFPFKARG